MSSALWEARQRRSASQAPIKRYDEDGVARERAEEKKKKSLDADDADEKDSLSLDVSFPHL